MIRLRKAAGILVRAQAQYAASRASHAKARQRESLARGIGRRRGDAAVLHPAAGRVAL